MSKENKFTSGAIFHLKKDEYAVGARQALDNAKEFVSIADFCQTKMFYAKGTANMIFAMEELAKAAYLQLKALNPHIRIANLDSYFHKHKVKHSGILDLVAVLGTSEDNSSTKLEKPTDRKNEGNDLIMIFFILFVAWIIHRQKDYQQSQKVNDWQGNGIQFYETTRQMGLYVEFNEMERTWTNPNEVVDSSIFKFVYNQIQDALNVVEKHLFGSQATSQRAVEIAEALNSENVLTRDARKQVNQP